MTAILGPDISHYQRSPDWAQVKASGHDFTVLKASEGAGYIDPSFAANREAAHAAGLIVGIYHFAEAGSASSEAAFFLGVLGSLRANEFMVLDWECGYSGDHVAWCKAWLDAVAAATGVRPLIYMNQSEMNAHNWMPVSAGSPLWLAKYDGTTAPPATCNCWPNAAMKQFTDKGSVPGVSSPCDVNVFYGSAQQLATYGTPNPSGDDLMAAADDIAYIKNLLMWGFDKTLGTGPAFAQAGEIVNRLGELQYALVPDDVPINSQGEVTKRVRAINGLVSDPASFAAALAPHLGSSVSQTDLEAALRKVLASIPTQ
jgi:GH25 family lysozyme M1 (1,4-beta-N-acetylmuramidase)